VRLLALAAAALVLPMVSFGQLHVIASGGVSGAFGKISPEFEKATGVTVVTTLGAS
jgi:ABC-type molybdate transport system substrate-binding protein